ncbi:MAG: ATP-binding protein [Clostridiales bacterium]|nr:ATP-binding protein [Clostridiales bacterium]
MMINNIIGRVLATEKKPTTIDDFTFWTDPELILNPFDIVKVEHVNNSYSYGVIEDIAHITDAASFLTNFISSDFGDVNSEENTLRVGMNYVTAKVICNTNNIYIPLQNNAKVMLATADEINYALGLNDIRNPLVCGYLEMYEGTKNCEKVTLPVNLNSKFIIGPEGAHLNISGISGLASKTSYAMFLLKTIQDSHLKKEPKTDNEEDSVAFVLFNVKGKDLLAIDQINDFVDEQNPEKEKTATFDKYKELGLSPEPFKNVHYYYPFSVPNTRHWNTYMTPEEVDDNIKKKKAKKFKYIYKYDKDNLDLMFSNIDDSTQTMESIISYIMSGQGKFNQVGDWQEFLEAVKEKCSTETYGKDKEIPVTSWRKFYRIINKSISDNKIFAREAIEEDGETRIGDALKYIKKNEVHVIDIAKLSEDKQAYVFGDAIRTIYDLQLGQYSGEEWVNPPSRIVIFIDELNKYASKETPKNSPILKQVLDVAERGRSLGVVLFAAEQFRSAIHDRVTGNCSTHAYGRTNSIEVTKSDYKSIPSVYKTMMTRLKQGEYIIQNPIFRSLLNIKFPKPIYKQFK